MNSYVDTAYPRVLSIGGFDGSGGAGIQADLKTITQLGCYGMTILTALPVQNTVGVRSVYPISPSCVEEQCEAIFSDIEVDAVKIGMVHRTEIMEVIARVLSRYRPPFIVIDPVMVAKSGHSLLLPEAIAGFCRLLLPCATLLTPNIPEAEALLGRKIISDSDVEEAASALRKKGADAVVIKGGHRGGRRVRDYLATSESTLWLEAERVQTKNTHGTGCTFSAAIAAFLAKGVSLRESFRLGKKYITEAIARGAEYSIGKGNGPVYHFSPDWEMTHVL